MMKENLIQVICGPGKGKTASALGRGVTALLKGKTVIMDEWPPPPPGSPRGGAL